MVLNEKRRNPDHLGSRYDILRWPAVANALDNVLFDRRIIFAGGISGKGKFPGLFDLG